MKNNYVNIIFGIFILIFLYIILLKVGIIKVDYFEGKNNLGEVLNHMAEDTKWTLEDITGTVEEKIEENKESSILEKLNNSTEEKKETESNSILDKLKKNNKVSSNTKVTSFSQAKRILSIAYPDIWERTVFCNCAYSNNKINYNDCGYEGSKYKNREDSIEWDHIVPAENFWRSFLEWREPEKFEECRDWNDIDSSRICAWKNKEFRFMESDLYNLYPAIWSLNALKSNYVISDISGESREFWSCDVEISDRKIEPPQEMKGDIARVYLYMQEAYPNTNIIGNKTKALISLWNSIDPISEEECKRYKVLKQFQLNENPILEPYCN